jgi:hypothetical protein
VLAGCWAKLGAAERHAKTMMVARCSRISLTVR